jgi:hypothetical protein
MKSNYNSLQARVEKRFHAGLYVMSNFTWDKSLDVGTFGPQNQFNFASNYGNSDATRPWAWISAFNWELPFGRGRMFANGMSRGADAVIGGWAFSGIVNLEAGQYFTPTMADASSLNSTIALRPDRIGSGRVSNPNRFEWFNPADFAAPAPFVYGNSGRNILEGPGFDSLDLSLAKAFAITERVHLEVKWDAFNALNHENLGNPNSSISPGVPNSPAGTITGIVDFRRRMQIGAHLTF